VAKKVRAKKTKGKREEMMIMKESFIKAALQTSRDFGYRSPSEERVRLSYEKVIEWKEKPENVIDMWVKDLWESTRKVAR